MNPTTLSCCRFTIGLFFLLQFLLLTYKVNAGEKVIVNGRLIPRYASQFMEPQNAARAIHDLAPLQWNVKLRRYAQRYARIRKQDCALIHSHGPFGENIFWGGGKDWKPAQASVLWVAERDDYNYTTNMCTQGKKCGHYTQIVWKDTKQVGCARVQCVNGTGIFMTCNYDPPGNYIGERPY